jgi:hypothetical protein
MFKAISLAAQAAFFIIFLNRYKRASALDLRYRSRSLNLGGLHACVPATDVCKLPFFQEDQSSSEASLDAGRNLQILAAITFQSDSLLLLPADHTIGTDGGANPAAHAFVTVLCDYSGDFVFGCGTSSAYCHTWRFIAVMAEKGHPLAPDHFHIQSLPGLRLVGQCPEEVFAARVFHGTGNLAGSTAHAPFRTYEYFLHVTSQAQHPALGFDAIDH